MSTTHGQPGLSSDQRSTIRSAILSTRHTLEDELRRQLEKYGIYENKKLPLENLTHLSVEEIHTRRTLDAAIERELESTEGDLERSITNYVHEATKTYLNRFVALKTIEVRGLVEETITERPEYGNRSYMHHTVAEIAGELTNAPDDGFGAALDLAYQEIGAEIRMIFEESEHTAIHLDAQVREEILDELDAIDDDAWESDEALGWVYQYFGEKEREDIDERVDKENYKITGTDIATKTQLFTPRYIVEWMVDNSLGRLWLEMQGEATNIDDEDNCFYLAPLEDSLTDRETKPVKEITILDPACGSGHMLFYAFDVLYQMYLEESEIPEKYIPREILRNNLYGVDIDSGAAQIAALSLYLKAKDQSPDIAIPQLNITSADAVLINGERKQDVLDRAGSELEERILEQVWRSFDNIREWGSLVRIEEQIEEIIEEEIDAIGSTGQSKFTTEGKLAKQSSVVSFSEEDDESWQNIKQRLLERVKSLAEGALERDDPVEEMFAEEVEKSVRLVDVFVGDYDVAVTNPPYLNSAKMGDGLKEYLKSSYEDYRDIYASFIQRCLELVDNGSYSVLVTPENYMFQSSLENTREFILSNSQFVEGVHLSRYGFEQQKDSYTIPFVLRKSNQNESDSRFYRMTHEQDEYSNFKDKIDGLNTIVGDLRKKSTHPDVFYVNQSIFSKIEQSPFVYWYGPEILEKFEKGTKFENLVFSQSGAVIGNNSKFLRKIWEVPSGQTGERYRPWVRSENSVEFSDQLSWVVDWKDNGQYAKDYCEEHGHQFFIGDEDYLGKSCVAFQDMSKRFIARKVPDGHITSKHFFVIHPKDGISVDYLNGWLNSSLCKFIMDGLNPTLHFMKNDVMRLPYIEPDEREEEIIRLSQKAEETVSRRFELIETVAQFDANKFANQISQDFRDLLLYEDSTFSELEILKGEIDEHIFYEYNIPQETKERVYEMLSQNISTYPYIENIEYQMDGGLPENESNNGVELSEAEYESLVDDINGTSSTDIRKISEEVGISPKSISTIRYKHDIYSRDEKKEAAGRVLSFVIGVLFDRWETREDFPSADSEIVTLDNTDRSLDSLLEECLETLFDDPYDATEALGDALGRDPIDWVQNRFFRYHHVSEYKRRGQSNPIYWQLESPEGAFSCFIYYHGIDRNTLPKLRGQHLDPRIAELENELETLTTQTSGESPDKELLRRKEEVQNDLDDLYEFRNTIDTMIDDGVGVDVEQGIWENIKDWDQYEVLETGLPKIKSSYSR
jgi:hypothetical protein